MEICHGKIKSRQSHGKERCDIAQKPAETCNFPPVVIIIARLNERIIISRQDQPEVDPAGNEVEVIPGDPLSQSTLLPGNNTVTEEVLKGLRGVEEKNNTYRLRSTFGLKLDLMKGLNISNTISLDYSQNNRNYFSPSWLNDPKESLTNGEVSREYTILDEALINYQQIFGERHKLDVMLGYSYQYDQYNYIGGTAQNGPSDYVHYATKYG